MHLYIHGGQKLKWKFWWKSDCLKIHKFLKIDLNMDQKWTSQFLTNEKWINDIHGRKLYYNSLTYGGFYKFIDNFKQIFLGCDFKVWRKNWPCNFASSVWPTYHLFEGLVISYFDIFTLIMFCDVKCMFLQQTLNWIFLGRID
jgi:hypothetical protein